MWIELLGKGLTQWLMCYKEKHVFSAPHLNAPETSVSLWPRLSAESPAVLFRRERQTVEKVWSPCQKMPEETNLKFDIIQYNIGIAPIENRHIEVQWSESDAPKIHRGKKNRAITSSEFQRDSLKQLRKYYHCIRGGWHWWANIWFYWHSQMELCGLMNPSHGCSSLLTGRHWALLHWNILFWGWYQDHRPGLCLSQRLLPT